jgi:hypothetical protein
MDFGKKTKCGNFYILKYSKSLSKAELKKLRAASGIPADVQKHLQRGTLPYIKVATVSDSWAVEFVYGTTMFNAIDELPVANNEVTGIPGKNAEALFVTMYADTSTIGDEEYRKAKVKIMEEYLDRASKAANEAADAGKSEEELQKESEEAVQEVIDKEKQARTILEMGEEIKKEEGV